MIAQTLFLLGLSMMFYYCINIVIKDKRYKSLNFYLGILISLFLLLLIAGIISINTNDKHSIALPQKNIEYKEDTLNMDKCWEYIINTNIQHPKVVLTQSVEESSYYQSSLFKHSNNLFGMKKSYQRVTVGNSNYYQGYKCYISWQQCIDDYALWQLQQNIANMNDLQYIDFLAKKYAKNPKYKQNLIKIYKTINYE